VINTFNTEFELDSKGGGIETIYDYDWLPIAEYKIYRNGKYYYSIKTPAEDNKPKRLTKCLVTSITMLEETFKEDFII
ncbi:hypothetical protein ACR91F_26705, partial [Klebsiella pneumoniae]